MPQQRSPIRQLYENLIQSSEIPIIERDDISSKGLYLSKDEKKEIYIKQSLSHREKFKVALHEYSHHIHFTHYFKDENRAECEIIANGAAFFVCKEFGLKLFKEVDLFKFSVDAETVKRIGTTSQSVGRHILDGLQQTNQEGGGYNE
jgi:hypothetical protein